MTDLADFLRARYAETREREQGKRKVIPSAFDDHNVEWRYGMGDPETLYVDGHPYPVEKYAEIATAPAPDPDVIADLDAKLAIIDLMERTLRFAEGDSEVDHYGAVGNADETLSLLARPFAGHPDYKEDWAA